MPKLNAIAMVVLTLGVIGGTGYLALRPRAAADGPAPAEIRKLLRNLADRDPDVRREAEAGLRALGNKAVTPLREAAASKDSVLASRARELLVAVEPPQSPRITAPESPAPEVASKVEIMEFVLESRGGQARAADLGALWVQFRNNGPSPVLVAHAPTLDHPKMAVFEVEDQTGNRAEVQAEILHLLPTDLRVLVPVRPHQAEILFQGGRALVKAVSKPGTYRIRFAFDASEGSDYRNLVKASGEGSLLPPVRFVSNTVTITVTE
jgi:hypothetical protein